MRTLRQLEDEIATLAAHMDAAMARWLSLIVEFDERNGWANTGCKTLAHWISFRCGVSLFTAREHVRVAYRLQSLPLVAAAFAAGELSYSKVRAICRVEDIEREAELVEFARRTTASQLEAVVRGYRSVLGVEQGAQRAYDERSLAWWWDEEGNLRLQARFPAEQGALLVKALEAARDELGPPPATPVEGVSAETPARLRAETVRSRNADALLALADASLAEQDHSSTGDGHQVVVHVDAEALARPSDAAEQAEAVRCGLENGVPLSREAARRLACDSSLVRVLERDGQPLSVGRKTRVIPPAMSRALRSRDGGCVFPGCTQTRRVDAHHIEHWADGGKTELSNLVQLCRAHHTMLHEGGFSLRRRGRAYVFFNPDGEPLPQSPRRPRGDCAQLVAGNERSGRHVSAETGFSLDGGGRMELGYAVDAIIDFCGKRRE